jgi:hypothetical protein
MSDKFFNHLYIEGPYDDLVSVTKDLDFADGSIDYDGWEIEGGSAVLHFNGYFCPLDEVENASIKYPSLKIIFRFSQELLSAGLYIYKDGKIKLRSHYDWDTGESTVTKY